MSKSRKKRERYELVLRCDCGYLLHTMAVSYFDGEPEQIIVEMQRDNQQSFGNRLQRLWNIFRGRESFVGEVVLSDEDVRKLYLFLRPFAEDS